MTVLAEATERYMDLIFGTFVEDDLSLRDCLCSLAFTTSLMALTLALFCFYLGDEKLNRIQLEELKILM